MSDRPAIQRLFGVLTNWREMKQHAADIAKAHPTAPTPSDLPEWNSLYQMLMFHIDEETSREIPSTKMKMTSESCVGTRANNVGSYDMLTDEMQNYLFDQGEQPYQPTPAFRSTID